MRALDLYRCYINKIVTQKTIPTPQQDFGKKGLYREACYSHKVQYNWAVAGSEIELQNITIKFGVETVFANINLHIGAGEKFVVVGPSGQGKSVLLKLMAGLLIPQEGRILIGGRDLNTIRGIERRNLMQRMGMLFQKNALFDSLTCGENIAFPLREVTSQSAEEIAQKVDFFLEAVGLSHAKALFPDEISGGMQKRLGIARALALNPDIIFYDDPTAGLDPITSRKIIDLIIDLQKKAQSTVVAITNDMGRAYQLADRIAMVVGRELIITGNVDQTKHHKDPRVHQFIRGEIEGPLLERAND